MISYEAYLSLSFPEVGKGYLDELPHHTPGRPGLKAGKPKMPRVLPTRTYFHPWRLLDWSYQSNQSVPWVGSETATGVESSCNLTHHLSWDRALPTVVCQHTHNVLLTLSLNQTATFLTQSGEGGTLGVGKGKEGEARTMSIPGGCQGKRGLLL